MIDKLLFWNIRSVNTQESFEKLIDLRRRHKYAYIALFEPFQGSQEIENYKRRLGMESAKANISGKIWVFWNSSWEGEVCGDTIQQLSVKFKERSSQMEFYITAIYARCSALERLELWDSLEYMAEDMTRPWMCGGDFNVILHAEEKLGGLPVTHQETTEFEQCLNTCNLKELEFTGALTRGGMEELNMRVFLKG